MSWKAGKLERSQEGQLGTTTHIRGAENTQIGGLPMESQCLCPEMSLLLLHLPTRPRSELSSWHRQLVVPQNLFSPSFLVLESLNIPWIIWNRLYFSASLVIRCSHVIKFWPMGYKWKCYISFFASSYCLECQCDA